MEDRDLLKKVLDKITRMISAVISDHNSATGDRYNFVFFVYDSNKENIITTLKKFIAETESKN